MENNEVRIFKALSDPIRVRIMALLSRGELCVCDLMGALNLPQSTTSRHLAKLREIKLITDRRSGNWKYYCINDQIDFPMMELNSILSHLLELEPYKTDYKNLLNHKNGKNCA